MTDTEIYTERLLEEKKLNHIAVSVEMGEEVLFECYRSADRKIDRKTLFDMASVTKILSTTPLILLALEQKRLSLEDSVSGFFDFPVREEYKRLKIENLLTHTMGIGHKSLNGEAVTNDNVAEYILNIPTDIAVGSDVLYSCPAFVLLGKIAEKVFGQSLDVLSEEKIFQPLHMTATCFLPKERTNIVNANRLFSELGTVNDYNARHLGGVAGNAGVFSDIEDLQKFTKMLRNSGSPIISKEIFDTAVQNHTPNKSESRGLGFVYTDEKYDQTGKLFPIGSFGHCGHTGQSIFVDRVSGLSVIILSDMTKISINEDGTENYAAVMKMRKDLHNAILTDLSEKRY